MPMECRFNKPTDEISKDEYLMYIYATRIWLLQKGLGLSFEMASLFNSECRDSTFDRMMEFREDFQRLPLEEKERIESEYWKEADADRERICQWAVENIKRFQILRSKMDVTDWSGNVKEFDYYA